MNIFELAMAKKMFGGSGGGEQANIQPLTVTENGTYEPAAEIDGYAPVVVDVKSQGGEIAKAFVPMEVSNNLMPKYAAPVCEFASWSAYTDTDSTLTKTFTYGEEGSVYIAAAAVRNLEEAPIPPEGWEQVAWVPYTANYTNKQSLLVLRHKVTANEANTDFTFSLDVVSGQRNYLIVLNLGDSDVDVNSTATLSTNKVTSFTPKLYDHTLVFLSASTAGGASSAWETRPWKNANGGYTDATLPSFTDNAVAGSRLGVLYIPFLNQQPFTSPTIYVCEQKSTNFANEIRYTESSDACYCSISFIPGTPTKWACVL